MRQIVKRVLQACGFLFRFSKPRKPGRKPARMLVAETKPFWGNPKKNNRYENCIKKSIRFNPTNCFDQLWFSYFCFRQRICDRYKTGNE